MSTLFGYRRSVAKTVEGRARESLEVAGEGDEKADELAKEGAMQDGGNMAQIGASSVQQRRREVYAALQYAARFHCLVEEWADCGELKPKPRDIWESVESKVEADKHRAEWCATTKNRPLHELREEQQKHEDAGKKWRRRTEAHGWALHDEKSRSGRRDPGVVQELFRIR